MNLAGQRIILSPFNESDLALFVEMGMCSQMMEHIYEPFTTLEEAQEAFELKAQPWNIESDGWLSLAIAEVSTGEKLGNIGLKIVNHEAKIAEVGFMVKQGAQGKGFAKEALNILIDYAFNTLSLNKLVAYCSAVNSGSYKLLEKTGFTREGYLKQNSLINNKYVDDYVYGLCQSELSR